MISILIPHTSQKVCNINSSPIFTHRRPAQALLELFPTFITAHQRLSNLFYSYWDLETHAGSSLGTYPTCTLPRGSVCTHVTFNIPPDVCWRHTAELLSAVRQDGKLDIIKFSPSLELFMRDWEYSLSAAQSEQQYTTNRFANRQFWFILIALICICFSSSRRFSLSALHPATDRHIQRLAREHSGACCR